MGRHKICWILPVIFVFFFHPGCKSQLPSSSLEISLYLPESGIIDGWERVRDLYSYRGEDLFSYINGGAEIYHEYGFTQVVVQDYKNAHERSLSVEIYEMTNPEAAYGIYSFKKSSDGVSWDNTEEGRLEGYYLNFWKGPYLVTITGFDEDAETVEGINAIAKTIKDNIPDSGDIQKPQLMNKLPPKDLIPGSEKYFRGRLGLFNSYPFSRQDIFRITEGASGEYIGGYRIFIIPYADPDQSVEQFKGIKESLALDPRYFSLNSSETAFLLRDDKETLLYFTSRGNFIVVVIGAEDFSSAEVISQGIQLN